MVPLQGLSLGKFKDWLTERNSGLESLSKLKYETLGTPQASFLGFLMGLLGGLMQKNWLWSGEWKVP